MHDVWDMTLLHVSGKILVWLREKLSMAESETDPFNDIGIYPLFIFFLICLSNPLVNLSTFYEITNQISFFFWPIKILHAITWTFYLIHLTNLNYFTYQKSDCTYQIE